MPRRDKVEDSESRGERGRLDSAGVRAFLSQPKVHQGKENGCEGHHNGEGHTEGNNGGGHDWVVRLAMQVVDHRGGNRLRHQNQGAL